MTLKKEAPSDGRTQNDKTLRLPRIVDYTSEFLDDLKNAKHSGRVDLNRVKEAIKILVDNDGPLPPEWRDHPLKGSWAGKRELHVKGDLLLIYEIDEGPKKNTEALILNRLGSHSEVF